MAVFPGAWTECTERTMAEETQRQECPHDDDLEIRPRTGTIGISEDGVPAKNIVLPYGGGVRYLPGATTTPVPLANGAQLAGGSSSGRRDPPQEMLPDRSLPVLKRIGKGQLTCLRLLEMVVHCYWPPPPPPPTWFDELHMRRRH